MSPNLNQMDDVVDEVESGSIPASPVDENLGKSINKIELIQGIAGKIGRQKCPECSYIASDAGRLKCHLRVHTGEKPFKCSHCTFATKMNGGLTRHLKAVHGVIVSKPITGMLILLNF